MELTEFRDQFDVLYNNITSNQAPGLDDYEKSVFLTRAQDDLLKSYFSPLGNKHYNGFDDVQRRQIDFSMIMKTVNLNGEGIGSLDRVKIIIPNDTYIIINEQVSVVRQVYDTNDGPTNKTITLVVKPLSYVEYERVLSKPYKRPLKYQAWRIITDSIPNDLDGRTCLVIASYNDNIAQYNMRYVRRPKPIILSDLEDGFTIDGISEATNCELDPIIHDEIVQRAVELAKAAYVDQDQLAAMISIGQASQTPKGQPLGGGQQ